MDNEVDPLFGEAAIKGVLRIDDVLWNQMHAEMESGDIDPKAVALWRRLLDVREAEGGSLAIEIAPPEPLWLFDSWPPELRTPAIDYVITVFYTHTVMWPEPSIEKAIRRATGWAAAPSGVWDALEQLLAALDARQGQ